MYILILAFYIAFLAIVWYNIRKGGICMNDRLQTEGFVFEYMESQLESAVLWENHCHAQYEMIAVLEGDISIMLEGIGYRLKENQAVIIPPLLYHAITANKRGTYRRVTALFDVAAIPEVLQPQFLKKDASLAIFSSDRIEELKRICQEKDRAYYAPLAQSLMIQFCYQDAQTEQRDVGGQTDSFLQQAIAYIDCHLSEKILLDDLAKHTARSKSSLCHLFQEKMNISPKQYILQKKVALAIKLIRDGTPATVAAMQVGYENYSNFYRIYQNLVKSNPSMEKTPK